MLNRQMSAVLGRPVQTNMSEVVRARSPMVYEKAAQQREQANADRAYELDQKNQALAERAQAHSERAATENLALQREQFEDNKKRTRTGQLISVGTGLANVYFGNREANAMEEAADAAAGKSVPKGMEVEKTSNLVTAPPVDPASSSGGASSGDGGGIWPTIKDGVVSGFGNIMAGGGIGLMAGQLFGDSKGEKAAIGAGAGALSNWVMNGGVTKLLSGGGGGGVSDLVGAAGSGLIGALGGFF